MKITVFTSNQPRHLSLIEGLAGIADTVHAVQECNTVYPGEVADFFKKSEVMQRYFQQVIAAEGTVFGRPRYLPGNVRQLALKMGDLNRLEHEVLAPALDADVYIVFGASYIKGWLIDHLVGRQAVNIHMGASPYYRGSSCNFWALADGRPELVGATIHRLSKGLDSGPMLYHAFPPTTAADPFVLGMLAVKSAHKSLIEAIRTGSLQGMPLVPQDKALELRYTRNADFTDEAALVYLENPPSPAEILQALSGRDLSQFLNPYVLQTDLMAAR